MLRNKQQKLNMFILLMAVFTLPFAARASTIYLSDTGWSDPAVGDWNPTTQTGTLMTDVYETIQIDSNGITLDGNGKTITGDGLTDYGVYLDGRTGVTIKNLIVQKYFVGISLCNLSTGNTLTNNTCSSNTWAGINLEQCSGNNIIGNTADLNERGINLDYSNDNTLADNISELNVFGIHLGHCSGNNITDNKANSNDRGINLDYSDDNILTDNISEKNVFGIYLGYCSSNSIIGNTANASVRGINLDYSNDNTLTDNISELNSWVGIRLFNSSSNTLTENNISNNNMGIQLEVCSDNQIYNNNFISNTTQASVSGGSNNIFNKSVPIGGNYWSDWTGPDSDGDGFVDYPYEFDGGQDELPWVLENRWWPLQAIQTLVLQVMSLNLRQGIVNSLDGKLQAALNTLDDINTNNNIAAINTLNVFIDKVEEQLDTGEISEDDADELITVALEIIVILSSE